MEISQFYDVNKRTQTEQVLKNQEDIAELKTADDTLQDNIDAEAQARTDADGTLADDIAELQNQIAGLGNVFTLKGSVATYGDLPATDNHIGDVWYVEADAVGYVWIDDNGTERWEQLGLPIDLSDYVSTSDLALALEDYQEKLTAGTNISIIGNTISATQPDVSGLGVLTGITAPSTSTQGSVGQLYLDTTTKILYECTAENSGVYTWDKVGGTAKQDKLTAGTNISIDADNVISASGGGVYSHLIKFADGIRTMIVNNDSNAFTFNTLANWLYVNGFTSNANCYLMFNQIISQSTNKLSFYKGIYSTDGTSIMYYRHDETFSTDGTSITITQNNQAVYGGNPITDTVSSL